jgi:hypothetical protein
MTDMHVASTFTARVRGQKIIPNFIRKTIREDNQGYMRGSPENEYYRKGQGVNGNHLDHLGPLAGPCEQVIYIRCPKIGTFSFRFGIISLSRNTMLHGIS